MMLATNWKLLRGIDEWNQYQQMIIDIQQSRYYIFEEYPESYPCLVQTISRAPIGSFVKTIHKQLFVYVNDALFLVDFIEGKIG